MKDASARSHRQERAAGFIIYRDSVLYAALPYGGSFRREGADRKSCGMAGTAMVLAIPIYIASMQSNQKPGFIYGGSSIRKEKCLCIQKQQLEI